MPDDSTSSLISRSNHANLRHLDYSPPVPEYSFPYNRMAEPKGWSEASHRKPTMMVIASYAFDWIILVALGVVGYILGNVTPNKRPFNLEDPDIS
jgi:hypothetical protein